MKSDIPTPLTAIILDLQSGKTERAGELIEMVQQRLYKFCLLLSHNREHAEDLCQDALIKALQNIGSLQNPATFMSWIYQITRNLYLDLKRNKDNQKFISDDVLKLHTTETHNDVILGVQKTLAAFEPEERFLLLLVELEEYSYKEAADIVGTTEDAVRSRLHRLRNSFIKKHQHKTAA